MSTWPFKLLLTLGLYSVPTKSPTLFNETEDKTPHYDSSVNAKTSPWPQGVTKRPEWPQFKLCPGMFPPS